MQSDIEAELKEAIERVLQSPGQKKLVVAGPGTGKTTLFRKLLESCAGDDKSRLVLTFINNLKADLEQSLGGLASVSTLHGYAQLLLHRQRNLRGGLTGDFRCLPRMASLIKKDWTYLREAPEPSFVGRMRGLESGEETDFYIARADYYDAVDFDDSVFRVYEQLKANPDLVSTYDLVLIDEYQDFNRMEAAFIDLLAEQSPIVVAGDDDQALYSQLRGASWDFIRELHRAGQYDLFELPFCMRCPEVIVDAVNDVVAVARQLKNLEGRIEKPYRHYAPVKGADSQRYPKIGLVACSVQRLKANYFGRYIEQAISQIPQEEIEEAADNGDPVVLVIGSRQYLRQIDTHLTGCGYLVDTRRDSSGGMDVVDGFRILNEDPESNLGWRVVLEFEKSGLARSVIREADTSSSRLIDVVPSDVKERTTNDVKAWAEGQDGSDERSVTGETQGDAELHIKLTSFEGAKGLSAQHVFIVGLHDGDLPRDATGIQDIEICRFLVGMTRTRKKCHLMYTKRFADQWKRPSPFLSWIEPERYETVDVNADYWKRGDGNV